MTKETMAKVVCGGCGWTSRRKTGQLVDCPECGDCATFDNPPPTALTSQQDPYTVTTKQTEGNQHGKKRI